MEADSIKRSLPNESDRQFTLDQMIEYMSTADVANEVISSLQSSNCQDIVTIEMAATALQHNGLTAEFESFLNYFSQQSFHEKFRYNYIPKVHLALYYFQKCLTSPDKADTQVVEETIRQASALEYKYFFTWLVRCFLELYHGNYKQAKEYHETAVTLFQQQADKKTTDDQAINDFKTIFNIQPLIQLASGFLKFGYNDYAEAFADFRELFVKSICAFPLLRLAIGMCLEKLNKKEDAIKAYKRCLKIDPTNITVLIRLMQIDKGNFVTYYKVAKEHHERNIPFRLLTLQFRFETLKISGKKKDKNFVNEARSLFEEIPKEQNEFRAEAIFQLTRYRHYTGTLGAEDLISFYRQVLEANPNHTQAQFAIAHLSLSLNKYEDAIANLEPIIERYTTQYEPHFILGMAYTHMYQSKQDNEYAKKAKVQLAEAIRLSQNRQCKELYKMTSTYGWLALKTLDFDTAYSQFKNTVTILEQSGQIPDDQTLTFFAITLFEQEKYQEALKTFDRVTQKTNPIIKFNIARCMEHLGRTSEAKLLYEELTKSHPRFPEPYIRLGVLSTKEKNFQLAQQYFETVEQECPAQQIRAKLYLAGLYNEQNNLKLSTTLAEEVKNSTHNMAGTGELSDGHLTAYVILGNAFLVHAQNKTETRDKVNYFHKAQSYFHAALKANNYCFAAASGLALYWLLNSYPQDAIQFLRFVKENQERMPGPAEALANAYLRGDGNTNNGRDPEIAAKEFDLCNKNHYDRTNTQLFAGAYMAYKMSQKYDMCLEMAQYAIQLEPDKRIFWSNLASSIIKNVQAQYSVLDKSRIRAKHVETWKAQAKRAYQLYDLLKQETMATNIHDTRSIESINKYMKYVSALIPKLETFMNRAREQEAARAQRYSMIQVEPEPNGPGRI